MIGVRRRAIAADGVSIPQRSQFPKDGGDGILKRRARKDGNERLVEAG